MKVNLNKSEIRLIRMSLTEYIDYLEDFGNEVADKRIINVRELKKRLLSTILNY